MNENVSTKSIETAYQLRQAADLCQNPVWTVQVSTETEFLQKSDLQVITKDVHN